MMSRELTLDSKQKISLLKKGFIQVDNPLSKLQMQNLDKRFEETTTEWKSCKWDGDAHPLAMRFALMGESTFSLPEIPSLLDLARNILETQKVHVGCCGAGNTIAMVISDGRPLRAVHWHSTPGPDRLPLHGFRQVAFRIFLDHHNRQVGQLHILPGTHLRRKSEMFQELNAKLSNKPEFISWNSLIFASHSDEIRLDLSVDDMLIWTPDTWHCTGISQSNASRRAITWIYFPEGGRFRDRSTLCKYFGHTIRSWSPERLSLWGIRGDFINAK